MEHDHAYEKAYVIQFVLWSDTVIENRISNYDNLRLWSHSSSGDIATSNILPPFQWLFGVILFRTNQLDYLVFRAV